MQKNTTIGLLATVVLLSIISFVQGGIANVLAGLENGTLLLLRVSALLAAAFAVAGMVQVLIPGEYIGKMLGVKSGIKGNLIAGIAGAIIPGGPYIYFPLAASFMSSGAALGPIITFIVAKNLWSLSRIPMEIALLGSKLTLIRYLSTLFFPPLAGMTGQILFGRMYEHILHDVKNRQRGGRE